MECSLFIVDKVGDLICSNPPRHRTRVGNVDEIPPGLSEDQLFQVRAWKSFASLAKSVAPIFSVTTYSPEHIEAEARFRVSPKAVETADKLDSSLNALLDDLREKGHHAVLDLTTLMGSDGAEMTVWKLALLADPMEEDPANLLPGLRFITEAVKTTRIGDHLMDPEEDWPPKRK